MLIFFIKKGSNFCTTQGSARAMTMTCAQRH